MEFTIFSPSGRAALECLEAFILSQLARGRACEEKVTKGLTCCARRCPTRCQNLRKRRASLFSKNQRVA